MKRSIAILLAFFLMLIVVSCGSSNSSEILTLPSTNSQAEELLIEPANNVIVYQTKVVEEYLAFLESFDESNNEILGITTCMYTGAYTSSDFYMVTYQKLDEPREV